MDLLTMFMSAPKIGRIIRKLWGAGPELVEE